MQLQKTKAMYKELCSRKYPTDIVSPSAQKRWDAAMDRVLKFQESNFCYFHHDILVYINGINVSQFLSGGCPVSYNLDESPNTFSCTIDGPIDAFRLNPNDVDWLQEVASTKVGNKAPSVDTLGYDTDGIYSIKRGMLANKFSPRAIKPTWKNGVEKPWPVNCSWQRDTDPSRGMEYMYTISIPGVSIFNKYDPVMAWVHLPYVGYDDDMWVPYFFGLIESTTIADDFTTGVSTVSISCGDMREWLSHLRLTYTVLINSCNPGPVFDNDVSIFTDVKFPSMINPFVGLNFDAAIYALIANGSFNTDVHNKQIQGILNADTASSGTASKIQTAAASAQAVPKIPPIGNFSEILLQGGRATFKSLAPILDKQQSGEKDLNGWHQLALFGPWLRPLSSLEVAKLGEQSGWTGYWTPFDMGYLFLRPANGVIYDEIFNYSVSISVNKMYEWQTRLSLLKDFCERAFYCFYVTPSGFMLFEPSMYDVNHTQFKGLQGLFTYDKHIKSCDSDDEANPCPCCIRISGGMGNMEEANNSIASVVDMNMSPFTQFLIVRHAVARYGAQPDERHYDWIDVTKAGGQEALTRFGQIEYGKALGALATASASGFFRYGLLPNRPFYFAPINRVVRIDNVSHSMEIGAHADTSMGVSNVRGWHPGKAATPASDGVPAKPEKPGKALYLFNGAERSTATLMWNSTSQETLATMPQAHPTTSAAEVPTALDATPARTDAIILARQRAITVYGLGAIVPGQVSTDGGNDTSTLVEPFRTLFQLFQTACHNIFTKPGTVEFDLTGGKEPFIVISTARCPKGNVPGTTNSSKLAFAASMHTWGFAADVEFYDITKDAYAPWRVRDPSTNQDVQMGKFAVAIWEASHPAAVNVCNACNNIAKTMTISGVMSQGALINGYSFDDPMHYQLNRNIAGRYIMTHIKKFNEKTDALSGVTYRDDPGNQDSGAAAPPDAKKPPESD